MEKNQLFLDSARLQRQAAQSPYSLTLASLSSMSFIESQRLVHELRVRQIELEWQNQALLKAHDQLEQSLERYTDLYDFAPTGCFLLTVDGTIQEVNHAGATLLDQKRAHLINRRFGPFVSTKTRPAFNAFLNEVLSSSSKVSCEVTLILEGMPPRHLYLECISKETHTGQQYRLTAINITERKQAQQKIEHLAYYDVLTQLPNRALLIDRLQQAMAQAQRNQRQLAVCYLDLDGFKMINDTWGHNYGDDVLVETARRLKSCVRTNDTVARLGGDEFILLLGDLVTINECEQALNRVVTALHTPFIIADQSIRLSTSLGVTLHPNDKADPDALLGHADQAMYVAKQAGGNRYCWFDVNHKRRAHYDSDPIAIAGIPREMQHAKMSVA